MASVCYFASIGMDKSGAHRPFSVSHVTGNVNIGLWFRVNFGVKVSVKVLVSISIYGSAVQRVNKNH